MRSGDIFINLEYEEVVVPSIWSQNTFVARAGAKLLKQMYASEDKRAQRVCLIPEVTAIIQEQWAATWAKNRPKPFKVFYVSRCYRYARPQKGRYREFTQIGAEILGGEPESAQEEVRKALLDLLDSWGLAYVVQDSVRRGISSDSGGGPRLAAILRSRRTAKLK